VELLPDIVPEDLVLVDRAAAAFDAYKKPFRVTMPKRKLQAAARFH
jgi:hypothetical protein